LLIDLDHFKRVNDQCGHIAGDALLRNVGRALQGTLRTGDAAVRYGGEEFLLMLHNSDETGAMRVAEAVREVLTKLPTPGNGVPRVTASIGVAFFPRMVRCSTRSSTSLIPRCTARRPKVEIAL